MLRNILRSVLIIDNPTFKMMSKCRNGIPSHQLGTTKCLRSQQNHSRNRNYNESTICISKSKGPIILHGAKHLNFLLWIDFCPRETADSRQRCVKLSPMGAFTHKPVSICPVLWSVKFYCRILWKKLVFISSGRVSNSVFYPGFCVV